MLAIGKYGHPRTLDVFTFVLGAMAGYLLLILVALGSIRAGATIPSEIPSVAQHTTDNPGAPNCLSSTGDSVLSSRVPCHKLCLYCLLCPGSEFTLMGLGTVGQSQIRSNLAQILRL